MVVGGIVAALGAFWKPGYSGYGKPEWYAILFDHGYLLVFGLVLALIGIFHWLGAMKDDPPDISS